MKTVKYTYWKDGDYYLGYLNDYPDYETQGLSKEELLANLKDMLKDIESGVFLATNGHEFLHECITNWQLCRKQ